MKNKISADSIKNFIDIEGLPKDAIIDRKQFTESLSIGPDEERTIIGKISGDNIDADGDMLIPMGCDCTKFQKNPVVLWSHKHSEPPIGKVTAISISEHSIDAKIVIADTDMGNECWKLLKGGFLRCSSIGFYITKSFVKGTKDFSDYVMKSGLQVGDNCQRIIKEFVLMENSLVPLPSNSEALVSAISTKALDISDKMKKDLGLPKIEIEEIPEQDKVIKQILEADKEVESVLVEVVEEVKPVEIDWTKVEIKVLRVGPYSLTDSDKLTIKSIKSGKIL